MGKQLKFDLAISPHIGLQVHRHPMLTGVSRGPVYPKAMSFRGADDLQRPRFGSWMDGPSSRA